MEDAAISELDIGGGNSIFGVFDGHGGTFVKTKALKYLNTSKRSLFSNLKVQNCTNSKNTMELWLKLSRKLMI